MSQSVLFVDDEVALLEALRRSLRREPFTVHVATSAIEAMGILQQHDIDVVVSDDEMPGVTGVDFLTQIRSLYPSTMRLMLTGRATVERMTQAVNEGSVFRFLMKPCPSSVLVEAVHHALDHKLLIDRGCDAITAMRRQGAILRWIGEQHPGILSQAVQTVAGITLKAEDFQTATVVADEMQIQIEDANRALEPKPRR
jgi:DNA-binding NtrC family response regulator